MMQRQNSILKEVNAFLIVLSENYMGRVTVAIALIDSANKEMVAVQEKRET